MKKRLKFMLFVSLLSISFLAYFIYKNVETDSRLFEKNGVLYALTLDGKKITSFPSKGMYQVSVNCTGANGKWSYDEWKLIMDNITDDVACDIDFNTLKMTYFNDYLISLQNTNQGNGKFVKEYATDVNYDTVVSMTQDDYTNSVKIFTSFYDNATSGSLSTDTFEFTDGKLISKPDNMISGTKYFVMFRPQKGGYYQLCYNLSSGNRNSLDMDKRGTVFLQYLYSSSDSEKSDCLNIGYLDDKFYFRTKFIAKDEISTLTLEFKMSSNTESVDTGYRYKGKNPNNYVWFNDEYWRIIGVFDESSHGLDGKKLVKIVKDDLLDSVQWNTKNENNWETSSLNLLLNGAYYNSQDGSDLGYCYGESNSVYNHFSKKCNYSKKGIHEESKKMIVNAKWYLGGIPNSNVNVGESYVHERGTDVYNSNPKSSMAFIGLMYPSDYILASVFDDHCKDISISDDYQAQCAKENWLCGYRLALITPNSLNNYVSEIILSSFKNGKVVLSGTTSVFDIKPTLYLDSSVYVIDGDGSLEDPYIIGM